MIISHKYKFIYIKTLKTAGTSLEIALSKHLGPDDVITPIDKADENLRKSLGHRTAQNFRPNLWNLPRELSQATRSGILFLRFYNHMPAARIKELVGSSVWDEYYKFTTVRHPYDLAVSSYYWWRKKDFNISNFSSFLRTHGPQLYRNTEIVASEGKLLIDGWVKFENFASDLEILSEKLNLPEPLWSTFRGIRAKGNVRSGSRSKALELLKEERRVVDFLCDLQFERFGYERS